MATTIPHVRVIRAEMGRLLVTCSRCRRHTMWATRYTADLAATEHQKTCKESK